MKVIDNNTKHPYCKKILKGDVANIKDVQNIYKEFEILHSLNHPCICRSCYINTQEVFVESTDTTEEMTTLSIYLEYVDFKIEECLNKGMMRNTLKARVVVEIAQGMKYLHEQGLIYRDLKLGNIMLNSVFETKLIDFGLVHISENEPNESIFKTKNVGEEDFMSPEMMKGEEYDNKTDVYSFGIIVYIIFTGNKPWLSIGDRIKGKSIQYPKESSKISKCCIDLLKKCLSDDPSDRPTFNEILLDIRSHNYMLALDVDPNIVSKRDKELE